MSYEVDRRLRLDRRRSLSAGRITQPSKPEDRDMDVKDERSQGSIAS
jgi:hypothetical protein